MSAPLLRTALRAGLLLAIAAGALAARADGWRRAAAPLLPQYRDECGACHTPYPAALLPPASWERLMASLPRHFGTDASLDDATRRHIADYLATNGGRRAGEEPPDNRITRSSWFRHQHRELAPAAWRLPAVKTPANCSACHPQANQGEFDEHAVRLPR